MWSNTIKATYVLHMGNYYCLAIQYLHTMFYVLLESEYEKKTKAHLLVIITTETYFHTTYRLDQDRMCGTD